MRPRRESLHNSIVSFPASGIHKIAAVDSDSADFGDARFALHGWLHRHDTPTPT